MKILFVEDDKTIAAGLEFSLQQEGYETIVCHDAKTCGKSDCGAIPRNRPLPV